MKILIVVDMQNDFIDGSLGTPEAKAIVPNVINKINNVGEETITLFTKDQHTSEYLNTLEGRNLPVEHCIKMTDGWCINKEVRSAWLNRDTIIIDSAINNIDRNNTILKSTFGSVDLCMLIKDIIAHEAITEITLIGLCTDICVISNALMLKSFFPEIPISVDAKCCAGVTPERHSIALEAMKACQINVKE